MSSDPPLNSSNSSSLNSNLNSNSSTSLLTALDVLQYEQALEQATYEQYPNQCDQCTYTLGALTQYIYSCRTCYPSMDQPQGVCYSCHIMCHADHDVLELDVKRSFLCDCGLNGPPECQLKPSLLPSSSSSSFSFSFSSLKEPSTVTTQTPVPSSSLVHKNQYNHNFWGRYCTCDAVYEESMEMYMCLHCQDWFHPECLENFPKDKESFTDLICKACTRLFPNFMLFQFPELRPFDSTSSFICLSSTSSCSFSKNLSEFLPIYLPPEWRTQLCQCEQCQSLYEKYPYFANEEDVYIPDPESPSSPSSSSSSSSSSSVTNTADSYYEKALKLLNRMDRVQVLEGISAVNTLSDKLKAYLRPFAEQGKVVTSNDIYAFFESLKQSTSSPF